MARKGKHTDLREGEEEGRGIEEMGRRMGKHRRWRRREEGEGAGKGNGERYGVRKGRGK